MRIMSVLAAAALSVLPAVSSAAVDFESVAPVNDEYVAFPWAPFSTGGLSFWQLFDDYQYIGVWNTGPGANNGTQFLISSDAALHVGLTGGGPFVLEFADVGLSYNARQFGAAHTITATFNLAGGGTATQSLVLNHGFQTFDLGDHMVTSVVFSGLGRGAYEAFDNLVYTVPGSAIPEASTWAMMLLGFGAIGIAMRRRARAAANARPKWVSQQR
jgi:PEP-CTERM motif-containing protein